MIINTAPANEAIVSNTGRTREFRINASAKAFKILSDGLYSNKIRAVIRELSCNAYDSHVAAGYPERKFEVHLPTLLEPWFAVRDFGVGLTDDEMYEVYTIYFESTKTTSNDYVGALGLGSKSPFSFTENFTVTTVKDGIKGIYTAFINQEGKPDLAPMLIEKTDEANGVEVKFAVENQYQFSQFHQEAAFVFSYFDNPPEITGGTRFEVAKRSYYDRDIVPGIHYMGEARSSVAVMGNIAYPISIPDTIAKNESLFALLGCGLEIHFPIGALEFQPSREQLGYDARTVEAIRARLEELNAALTVRLARDADLYENLWDRVMFLQAKRDQRLWSNAVTAYVKARDIPFVLRSRYGEADRKIKVTDLEQRFNIAVGAFQLYGTDRTARTIEASSSYDNDAQEYIKNWVWNISRSAQFVINDTKVGAVERAKYHWRSTFSGRGHRVNEVYVLTAADRTRPMNVEAFFEWMHNPPQSQIHYASTLMVKPRQTVSGKDVTILGLQRRSGSYYRNDEYVWRDAGKADTFDAKETFYYIPLSGYQVADDRLKTSPHQLLNLIKESGIARAYVNTIYGVRKTDLPWVKQQKNWVNIYDHISKIVNNLTDKDVLPAMLGSLEVSKYFKYNAAICNAVSPDSAYYKFAVKTRNIDRDRDYKLASLELLVKLFEKQAKTALANTVLAEYEAVQARYPLLHRIKDYTDAELIVDYIKLVDGCKA